MLQKRYKAKIFWPGGRISDSVPRIADCPFPFKSLVPWQAGKGSAALRIKPFPLTIVPPQNTQKSFKLLRWKYVKYMSWSFILSTLQFWKPCKCQKKVSVQIYLFFKILYQPTPHAEFWEKDTNSAFHLTHFSLLTENNFYESSVPSVISRIRYFMNECCFQ